MNVIHCDRCHKEIEAATYQYSRLDTKHNLRAYDLCSECDHAFISKFMADEIDKKIEQRQYGIMHLTERQKAILEYISQEVREGKKPPTLKKIGEKFGISMSRAMYHVHVLQDRGAVAPRVRKSQGKYPTTLGREAIQ